MKRAITVALKMRVDDLRPLGRSWTVKLHEKRRQEHLMKCHHALAEARRMTGPHGASLT
jgi:hypothetical protein